MVYFMQPVDGGPIKIGYTANLPERLATLQSFYARRLHVIATIDGGRDVERAMHVRFAAYRFPKTEQFAPGEALTDFLDIPAVADISAVVPMLAARPSCCLRVTREKYKAVRHLAIEFGVPIHVMTDELLGVGLATMKGQHAEFSLEMAN